MVSFRVVCRVFFGFWGGGKVSRLVVVLIIFGVRVLGRGIVMGRVANFR